MKLWIRKAYGQAQGRHRSKDQGGGLKQLPNETGVVLPPPCKTFKVLT